MTYKKGVSEMGSVRKIDLSYKHKLSVVVGQEKRERSIMIQVKTTRHQK